MAHQAGLPLSIVVSSRDGAIRVALSGDAAEGDASEAIGAELDRVHARAIAEKTRDVVVDVRALEFTSTGVLRKFVGFVGLLEAQGTPPPYRIHFLSNPQIRWQRRGLRALESLAGGAVKVEES